MQLINIYHIPDEVILQIISFLPLRDFAALARSCRWFCQYFKDPHYDFLFKRIAHDLDPFISVKSESCRVSGGSLCLWSSACRQYSMTLKVLQLGRRSLSGSTRCNRKRTFSSDKFPSDVTIPIHTILDRTALSELDVVLDGNFGTSKCLLFRTERDSMNSDIVNEDIMSISFTDGSLNYSERDTFCDRSFEFLDMSSQFILTAVYPTQDQMPMGLKQIKQIRSVFCEDARWIFPSPITVDIMVKPCVYDEMLFFTLPVNQAENRVKLVAYQQSLDGIQPSKLFWQTIISGPQDPFQLFGFNNMEVDSILPHEHYIFLFINYFDYVDLNRTMSIDLTTTHMIVILRDSGYVLGVHSFKNKESEEVYAMWRRSVLHISDTHMFLEHVQFTPSLGMNCTVSYRSLMSILNSLMVDAYRNRFAYEGPKLDLTGLEKSTGFKIYQSIRKTNRPKNIGLHTKTQMKDQWSVLIEYKNSHTPTLKSHFFQNYYIGSVEYFEDDLLFHKILLLDLETGKQATYDYPTWSSPLLIISHSLSLHGFSEHMINRLFICAKNTGFFSPT